MKHWIFILLLLVSACSVPYEKNNTVILKYEEFGPQVIAQELLGNGWWQWQAHGDSRPRKYDIKVVVYKNHDIEKVKEIYPVIPEKFQDYRYVSYDDTIKYLDEKIKEDVMVDVTMLLKQTRYKVIVAFD